MCTWRSTDGIYSMVFFVLLFSLSSRCIWGCFVLSLFSSFFSAYFVTYLNQSPHTILYPRRLHTGEPRPSVFNLEHVYRDFGAKQGLFARQIHRCRETCDMGDWRVACRTFPAASSLLRTWVRCVAALFFEYLDANVAELVGAGTNAGFNLC
jgi:hypothetical protein